MGADQRNAIRKALNEDAAKLLEEGDPSDPQLRRLRREMDEVNRLFDEFERRAREEGKLLTDEGEGRVISTFYAFNVPTRCFQRKAKMLYVYSTSR